MKKINALLIVLLFTAYCTQAQLSIGLKAGANFSALKGDGFNDPDQKLLTGMNIGGLVNYAINEKFSLQPELFFSQEGTQWKGSDYEEKYHLNYLNVPILLQYSAPSGFFAHTGPQIGLLLSAKTKYKDDGPGGVTVGDDYPGGDFGYGETHTVDIKEHYSSSPISWGLGAGYIHESGFGINARYNIGLTNTLKKSTGNKVRSSVINIGIIYMLKPMKN